MLSTIFLVAAATVVAGQNTDGDTAKSAAGNGFATACQSIVKRAPACADKCTAPATTRDEQRAALSAAIACAQTAQKARTDKLKELNQKVEDAKKTVADSSATKAARDNAAKTLRDAAKDAAKTELKEKLSGNRDKVSQRKLDIAKARLAAARGGKSDTTEDDAEARVLTVTVTIDESKVDQLRSDVKSQVDSDADVETSSSPKLNVDEKGEKSQDSITGATESQKSAGKKCSQKSTKSTKCSQKSASAKTAGDAKTEGGAAQPAGDAAKTEGAGATAKTEGGDEKTAEDPNAPKTEGGAAQPAGDAEKTAEDPAAAAKTADEKTADAAAKTVSEKTADGDDKSGESDDEDCEEDEPAATTSAGEATAKPAKRQVSDAPPAPVADEEDDCEDESDDKTGSSTTTEDDKSAGTSESDNAATDDEKTAATAPKVKRQAGKTVTVEMYIPTTTATMADTQIKCGSVVAAAGGQITDFDTLNQEEVTAAKPIVAKSINDAAMPNTAAGAFSVAVSALVASCAALLL